MKITRLLPMLALTMLVGTTNSNADQIYKVKKGDTLYKISRKFDIRVEQIREINSISSEDIRPGTKLKIPSKASTKDLRPTTELASQGQEPKKLPSDPPLRSEKRIRHTVEKGDTLYSISRKYSVSVKDLQGLNGLRKGERLKAGTSLVIREATSGASTAEVGDPAAEAASQAGAQARTMGERPTAEQREPQPALAADTGGVGKEPKKIAKEEALIGGSNQTTSAANKSGATKVVVRKGDTLDSIARKYSLSVAELRELNGLKKKTKLKSGMTLTVRTVGVKTYIVKKGDTVSRIAKKFNLRNEDLTRMNGLDRRGVKVGQRLIVGAPAAEREVPSSESVAEHTVEEAEVYRELRSLSEQGKDPPQQATLKERMVRVAKRMLNIPYRFGGESLRGIDCSAYVQKVFRFLNIPLPRTAREQFNEGENVTRDELAEGDLVFFRTYASFPSHVGIYLGNNQFIHASSVGRKVTIDSLEKPYYSKRFIGGKRLVPETPEREQAPKPEESTAG